VENRKAKLNSINIIINMSGLHVSNNESDEDLNNSVMSNSSEEIVESFKDRLEKSIYKNTDSNETGNKSSISNDIDVYRKYGQMTTNLRLVYDCLKSIPLTTTEAERCFSIGGFILNKRRSRMSAELLNAIHLIKTNKHYVLNK